MYSLLYIVLNTVAEIEMNMTFCIPPDKEYHGYFGKHTDLCFWFFLSVFYMNLLFTFILFQISLFFFGFTGSGDTLESITCSVFTTPTLPEIRTKHNYVPSFLAAGNDPENARAGKRRKALKEFGFLCDNTTQ